MRVRRSATALVPVAHYKCDIVQEIKQFRSKPENRVTPEIQKVVRQFAFTMANRASKALGANPSRFLEDFERCFFWRAYGAIDHGNWDPARCRYQTWVTNALKFECRSLCEKLSIEQIRWAKTRSLDAPISPSGDAAEHTLIEFVRAGTDDFYSAIDIADVRSQIPSYDYRLIFDAIVDGVRGWRHFANIMYCSRHEWYEKVWPDFCAVVRPLISDWRVA